MVFGTSSEQEIVVELSHERKFLKIIKAKIVHYTSVDLSFFVTVVAFVYQSVLFPSDT